MSQKQTGPLQNLYIELKRIIEFMETKNGALAKEYETQSSASKAELYLAAMKQQDSYITYKNWWTIDMFREMSYNFKMNDYNHYIAEPYSVPLVYRENLLIKGREAFLNSYVEENTYYRALMGLPALDDTDYIYLSDELQEEYHVDNIPIHELSTYIQNKYIETEEYAEVLKNNPDKLYLKYLGLYKIDLYTARTAKDFDIIRYPVNRSDINPHLLNEFASIYADAREYTMVTLYNTEFESMYEGYRTFMGFIILSYALMHTNVKALENVTSHKYMDDTILYIILSMYGIPDTLLLTKEVRRNLALHIMRLVKEKGTNSVYYDLINILGYQDIVISKLMLMKGQKFDNNGNALNEFEPYFLQLDLKDENPYETIVSNKALIHSYESIVSKDPTWWDGEEVQNILKSKQYSEADSKYIMIEGVIHQMRSMFETIYFSRMVIDNYNTDDFMISIPEIFGTKQVSIYDCMLFLICATCMNNGLSGEIYTDTEKLLATAGFNFDLDMDTFINFIDNSTYLEKDRIKNFISNLSIQTDADISRLFTDVMYPLREWLENKIATSSIREEYLEYEAVYRALFTYDITRNKVLDRFEMPMETIKKKYDLSDEDITALKYFYPHNNGEAITVEDFNESINKTKYHYPFLSITDPVDWYIHITVSKNGQVDDRGYLYFYDILNCKDVRTLKNSNGDYIFMDDYGAEEGWRLNTAAVNRALYLIEHLEDDDLKSAYFQIYTPKDDGTYYEPNEKLPASVRTNVFKSILYDKVKMDTAGLAEPPTSYFEYLNRKNPDLYNILLDPEADRFNLNKDAWMNDVMAVIIAMETELSLHIKYLEQTIVGKDLFFKPLITLIKHFKSLLVEITNTGLKYIFDDKMDVGGNSNMLKLFDKIQFIIHFSTIKSVGYDSDFQLYDTLRSSKISIVMSDRSERYKMTIGEGFAAEQRTTTMGSVALFDEMKFYKNGKPIESEDGSMWHTGEPGAGRWSEEDEVLMKVRKGNKQIPNVQYDLDGWKDYVESYVQE